MNTFADPGLVYEVRRYGRFDVEGCLNCGSCTVVCDLAGADASFPRKPMQQTILGLKSSLDRSLEPWLCYDCGDCASACPRQTEPRESMMTLRRYLAARYDVTGIASRICRSRRWELLAIGFLAALVFALVILYHLYYVELAAEDFVSTSLGLEHMFPTIVYFTYVVFLLPLAIMCVNAVKMGRMTMAQNQNVRIPIRFYAAQAGTFLFHLLSHRNLKRCSDDRKDRRWIKHWLLGTACMMMCIIPLFFLEWFQTDALYPLEHPQRWLGYIATAVMLFVPLEIIIGRIRKRGLKHKYSEATDLVFPIMLFLVAATGIAVHVFRYTGLELACHYSYAIHLAVTVPLIMIEMPFGKWSHVLYRPLALYLQAVRERATAEAGARAPAPLLKGTQPT